jgi:thiol-disulfide isomerase/thioredoxin
MTRRRSLGACILAALLATSVPAAGDPLDFRATRLDGSAFSGTELAGKAVLLDFWGSWCAPCVHAFPTLRRLHADFGDRLTVVGLAFYSGELADIERFAAEHELDYTVLEGHDDALEEFEIFVFPSYVLISAAGEVLFVQAGEADDLYARVAAALGEG